MRDQRSPPNRSQVKPAGSEPQTKKIQHSGPIPAPHFWGSATAFSGLITSRSLVGVPYDTRSPAYTTGVSSGAQQESIPGKSFTVTPILPVFLFLTTICRTIRSIISPLSSLFGHVALYADWLSPISAYTGIIAYTLNLSNFLIIDFTLISLIFSIV